MKLYCVSREYLPLVQSSISPVFFYDMQGTSIIPRAVKKEEVLALFDIKSRLMAFESKEDAKIAATSMLQKHNVTLEKVAKGCELFASPVIFEVECEETNLKDKAFLTPETLSRYGDCNAIPFYKNYDFMEPPSSYERSVSDNYRSYLTDGNGPDPQGYYKIDADTHFTTAPTNAYYFTAKGEVSLPLSNKAQSVCHIL